MFAEINELLDHWKIKEANTRLNTYFNKNYKNSNDFEFKLNYNILKIKILLAENDIKSITGHLNILLQILDNEQISEENIARIYELKGDIEFKKVNLNNSLGEYKRSLSTFSKLKKNKEIANLNEKIGIIYENKGNNDFALKYHEKSLSIRKEFHLNYASSIYEIGSTLFEKGNLEEALKFSNEALELRRKEEKPNDFAIANSLNLIGLIYWDKGDHDKAQVCFEESMNLRKKLGYLLGVSGSLNNLGLLKNSQGELKEALKYFEECYKIRKKINADKIAIAVVLKNLGIVYRELGDLNKAQKYHEDCLKIRKEVSNPFHIASSYSSLGYLYHDKGDLKKALDYHQRALKLREDYGNTYWISDSLNNLGTIYYDLNEHKKALNLYLESLKIRQEIGNDLHTAETLFNIVQLSGEKNYLDQLLEIARNADNRMILNWARLANAIVLSKDKRMLKKSQAQLILNDIALDDIDEIYSKFLAIQTLCDTLLFELKASQDEEVYNEINDFVYQLNEIASKVQSVRLSSEALLLKSKLAVYRNDISIAMRYLEEALHLTEKNDYWRIQKDILAQQQKIKEVLIREPLENIRKNVNKIVEIAEEIDTREKIKYVQLSGYLQKQEQQKRIIKVLKLNPKGLLQKEIQEKTKLTKSTLSRRLRELEIDTIVLREPKGNSILIKLINENLVVE